MKIEVKSEVHDELQYIENTVKNSKTLCSYINGIKKQKRIFNNSNY
jgi:hypothetical protein